MYSISEIKVSYSSNKKDNIKVKHSNDCFKIFLTNWNKDLIELQEKFKVLLLNRNHQVLGIYNMSKGGVSGTIVDAKLIFSVALKCNASSIVIAHNHPSGNLKPSEADKTLTNKLKKASSFLEIQFLDHLILSGKEYYSFADNSHL